MRRTKGRKGKAADLLGIDVKTLYNKRKIDGKNAFHKSSKKRISSRARIRRLNKKK